MYFIAFPHSIPGPIWTPLLLLTTMTLGQIDISTFSQKIFQSPWDVTASGTISLAESFATYDHPRRLNNKYFTGSIRISFNLGDL
jgi:hypothetical protein